MVLKLSKKVQFLKFYADLSKKSNQANIFWSSKRLDDVFKTWLQHVFSVTIFRLPRRLEDVLKTSLKTKKLLRWRCLEDVLKTCLQAVFKTFRRQTKCLLGSVLCIWKPSLRSFRKCYRRVWATVHDILAIKISKKMLTQQKFNKIFWLQTLLSPKE